MKMQSAQYFVTALLLCVLGLLIHPQIAFAQDACNELSTNTEWNNGIKVITQLIQSNRYDDARVKAKSLSRICDHSPVLHYLQGKIAHEMGQKQDALLYYQKASEYTYKIEVDPDLAKKIWYARYENEHPERTAESIKETDILLKDKDSLYTNTTHQFNQFSEDIKSDYYKWMWAGAGIGLGGLVLAGTGIGLLVNNSDPAIIRFEEIMGNGEKRYTQKPNTNFVVSCVLMSSGAVLAITGAVLTGVFGYKYSHWTEHAEYSIVVSPNNAALSIQF